MSLKLPSNSVPFSFYRVPSQIGGLQRAAAFDLPKPTQPPVLGTLSPRLAQSLAEAKLRGEF